MHYALNLSYDRNQSLLVVKQRSHPSKVDDCCVMHFYLCVVKMCGILKDRLKSDTNDSFNYLVNYSHSLLKYILPAKHPLYRVRNCTTINHEQIKRVSHTIIILYT